MNDLLSLADILVVAPVVCITLTIMGLGLFLGHRSRDGEIRLLQEMLNRTNRGRDV